MKKLFLKSFGWSSIIVELIYHFKPRIPLLCRIWYIISTTLVCNFADSFLLLISTSVVVRNRVKYAQFRKKRMNTNPSRGPFHFKAPAKMFWRTVRGMVNQKTARGQAALGRLSTFEGTPHPYDKMKRQVVPAALKVLRLKPTRKFTVLGELADSVGWKHKDLVGRLEEKRKVKAAAFYERKKARTVLRAKATQQADLSAVAPVLAAAGY